MSLSDRYELQHLYDHVRVYTEAVCDALSASIGDTFIWLDMQAEQRIEIADPLERLQFILQLYTLHPSQKPKTVLMCPGLIAATPTVFEAVLKMNEARQKFQSKMVETRKKILGIQDSTLDNQFGNPTHERPKAIDNLLREMNLHHLHFKHVYRCLPVLHHAPQQIAWTWALTQSIKKLSYDQVKTLLEKKAQKTKNTEDLEKLALLPRDSSFSIRQELAPHLRINCLDHQGKRKMLKGTLPVVFPKAAILPQIRPAKDLAQRMIKHVENQEDQQKSAFRKDRTIGDTPFFPAIRVYLHKDQEREFFLKYPQWKTD